MNLKLRALLYVLAMPLGIVGFIWWASACVAAHDRDAVTGLSVIATYVFVYFALTKYKKIHDALLEETRRHFKPKAKRPKAPARKHRR